MKEIEIKTIYINNNCKNAIRILNYLEERKIELQKKVDEKAKLIFCK